MSSGDPMGHVSPFPWFQGMTKVKFCVEETAQFAVEQKTAVKRIVRLLKETAKTHPDRIGAHPRFTQVDCASTHELAVLLGITTPQVQEALELEGREIHAFTYSVRRNPPRGYIWFANDPMWEDRAEFESTLAYQIHLVFGLDR